jgi:hypothetical protein
VELNLGLLLEAASDGTDIGRDPALAVATNPELPAGHAPTLRCGRLAILPLVASRSPATPEGTAGRGHRVTIPHAQPIQQNTAPPQIAACRPPYALLLQQSPNSNVFADPWWPRSS